MESPFVALRDRFLEEWSLNDLIEAPSLFDCLHGFELVWSTSNPDPGTFRSTENFSVVRLFVDEAPDRYTSSTLPNSRSIDLRALGF
jgi:hypothetical protein